MSICGAGLDHQTCFLFISSDYQCFGDLLAIESIVFTRVVHLLLMKCLRLNSLFIKYMPGFRKLSFGHWAHSTGKTQDRSSF